MQNGHKVPPLLRGNGKQLFGEGLAFGGPPRGVSPIMSTHHKDGMTTD